MSNRTIVAVALGLLVAACGDGRTPLVIYSPHGVDLLSMVEDAFEATHPGVDVRWLDMGSQDVLDRVRSEKANPQSDVWFGGPSYLFARAASESLLVSYEPAWAGAIPERARGNGGFFHAVYETPAVIAFNSDVLNRETAPQDWDDVLQPRWDGKVVIRDPMASGTMRAIFGMMVMRGLDRTGDTAWGFDWLRRLDGQTRAYALNPAMLHLKLIQREGVVTLWDLPDILVEGSQGQPFGFVMPSSGTPVIEDAIAIVRGTDHEDAAREFVDWVGSIELQLMSAREQFRLPARLDLPDDSLPEWVRDVRSSMVVEDMDWTLLADRGAEWMEDWDRHARGRGE